MNLQTLICVKGITGENGRGFKTWEKVRDPSMRMLWRKRGCWAGVQHAQMKSINIYSYTSHKHPFGGLSRLKIRGPLCDSVIRDPL